MNELQEKILNVIMAILEADGMYEPFKSSSKYGKGRVIDNSSIRYGILNYIAKYSLANDKYLITSKCFEHLNALNLLRDGKLLRGYKGSKNQFTFEHPVPVNLVADQIISNRSNTAEVFKLLKQTNLVTVITYEENELLKKAGLNHDMPEGSFAKGDVFARYHKSGIEVPQREIEVYGAIAR